MTDTLDARVTDFLTDVLGAMGLTVDVALEETPDAIRVNVTGAGADTLLRRKLRERRECQPDRTLLGDLGFVGVAHSRAVHDRSGSGEHPGSGQQGLDECGLAATRWAYEHHVSDGGRTVRGGGGSGALGSIRLVSHDGPFQTRVTSSGPGCKSTIPLIPAVCKTRSDVE